MALGVPLNGAGLVAPTPSTPRSGLSMRRPPTNAHLGQTRAPAGFNRQLGMGRPDRSFATRGATAPLSPPTTRPLPTGTLPPSAATLTSPPQSHLTAPGVSGGMGAATPPSIGQANSAGTQPPSVNEAPSLTEMGNIPAGATKMSYGAYGKPPGSSDTSMGRFILQGLGI